MIIESIKYWLRRAGKLLLVSPVFMLAVLGVSAVPLLAFEAQIINVTANIENPPFCEARSKGYWANNEGCHKGSGESLWADEVHELSSNSFSGLFNGIDGAGICSALWIPNCKYAGPSEEGLCKAKAKLLANELNVVSEKLYLGALIALADDGRDPFDALGLSATSTIEEALMAVEAILANPEATRGEIRDADYVSERIYTFYEKENRKAPMCILRPEDIPEKRCPRKTPHHYDSHGRAVYEIENGFEIYGKGDPRHYEDCNEDKDWDKEEDCKIYGECDEHDREDACESWNDGDCDKHDEDEGACGQHNGEKDCKEDKGECDGGSCHGEHKEEEFDVVIEEEVTATSSGEVVADETVMEEEATTTEEEIVEEAEETPEVVEEGDVESPEEEPIEVPEEEPAEAGEIPPSEGE